MNKIISPISRELIKQELTEKYFLRKTNKADNEIYIFSAKDCPNTMLEIGRLREEAFRYYGGGTGKEVDIDDFDTDPNDAYMQLIVWSPDDNEIIGGYRFIFGSDVNVNEDNKPRLATAEMFNFSDEFIHEYLPYTIELGRSFVSLPYQSTLRGSKSMFALDNLWDGLGALTRINPNMKYFYGKVTMYKDYNKYARNLILYFLNKYFEDKDKLVVPTDPLPIDLDEDSIKRVLNGDNFKQDYRSLNKEVRSLGINIPPLVNAYMSLSPEMKVFGTGINESFGYVEETGILIAVDKILKEKIERHVLSFNLSRRQRKLLWQTILKRVGLAKK